MCNAARGLQPAETLCAAPCQALTADLEERLACVSGQLSTSRALEGRLQQRLAASVPAAQLQEMAARLQVGSQTSPRRMCPLSTCHHCGMHLGCFQATSLRPLLAPAPVTCCIGCSSKSVRIRTTLGLFANAGGRSCRSPGGGQDDCIDTQGGGS